MIRLLIFVFLAGAIEAHRLPIQVYTTAQGLPRNTATCLVADSKGLLWICTSEGLVRFDGSEFRTFGSQQAISTVMEFLPSAKGGAFEIGSSRTGASRKFSALITARPRANISDYRWTIS